MYFVYDYLVCGSLFVKREFIAYEFLLLFRGRFYVRPSDFAAFFDLYMFLWIFLTRGYRYSLAFSLKWRLFYVSIQCDMSVFCYSTLWRCRTQMLSICWWNFPYVRPSDFAVHSNDKVIFLKSSNLILHLILNHAKYELIT